MIKCLEYLPESDFLTVFYGIIDLGTLEMIYTNAGHPRPFLFKRDSGEIQELGTGGPLVGALSGDGLRGELLYNYKKVIRFLFILTV